MITGYGANKRDKNASSNVLGIIQSSDITVGEGEDELKEKDEVIKRW